MMKRLSVAIIAFLLLSAFSYATYTWTNDDAHSQVQFTVTHLGIADVTGTINDFDAKITTTKADFSDAVFEFTGKVASLDTRVEARNNHLKSADFFDAAQYPLISFKSNSLKKAGKNKFKVTGDLTLHGITKQVSLDLVYRGSVVNAMNQKQTTGFQVTGTIKRSDFNLGNGFPPPMISNEVRIKADGEFVQ
ncbi:MAG TPA: YceI family protein [Chitinophagaceae bacterium]